VKFIDQTFGSAQAKAQATSAGVTVTHRQFDVGDSWPLILEDKTDALAHTVHEVFNANIPATTVVQSVAREFARGRDKFRLIDQRETLIHRRTTDCLPNTYDVRRRLDR
jgi:hypothetical protein